MNSEIDLPRPTKPVLKPAGVMTPALPFSSQKTPYEPTLPAISEIVDTKLFSDIRSLDSVFENAQIPWIEHCYKAAKNLKYQELGRAHRYFTRTRRRSSLVFNLSDLLKLLYLTRTRNVAQIRTRLALAEIAHRRACAGRVGRWSMTEFRVLVGSTRITDSEVMRVVQNPRVEVPEGALEAMAAKLGRHNLQGKVWVPRRLVRYLAKRGSRLEIAVMLTMMARRMVNRFQRARVSARLVAELSDSKEAHVTAAMLKLQERRLLMRNRQAERWSVNRYGSLWEFPEDLSITAGEEVRPLRAPPRRVGRFERRPLKALLSAMLRATLMQKGGDLINTDPSLQLEPQLLMGKPPAGPPVVASEVGRERKRLASAAAALKLFRGEQGDAYRSAWSNVHTAAGAAEVFELRGFVDYQRLRDEFPPHIPERRFYGKNVGCDSIAIG